MDLLRKFGKPVTAFLISIGTFLIISAFFVAPQAFSAQIITAGNSDSKTIKPDNPLSGNWLLEAGIHLFPGDRILYRGAAIGPSLSLPAQDGQILVYQPASLITLELNGEMRPFYSAAPTLGEALWEQGIIISSADRLSLPMTTPVNGVMSVSLRKASPIRILVDGREISASSSADTTGGALADAGISLMGLDYSQPDESQPLPTDRMVRVIRVREEQLQEEEPIPFSEERIPDPDMAVGEQEVLQTGVDGIKVTSLRVRYEDGEEVERVEEAEWIARQPTLQRVAYGSTVEIQSFEGFDCWLTKEVQIYSYQDTGDPTSSGLWPTKGTIAVSLEWYRILKGTSIYVPGYGVGTVLDTCPGCAAENAIDVFYPTAEYVPWSKRETVCFMTPAPANFTGELP